MMDTSANTHVQQQKNTHVQQQKNTHVQQQKGTNHEETNYGMDQTISKLYRITFWRVK